MEMKSAFARIKRRAPLFDRVMCRGLVKIASTAPRDALRRAYPI